MDALFDMGADEFGVRETTNLSASNCTPFEMGGLQTSDGGLPFGPSLKDTGKKINLCWKVDNDFHLTKEKIYQSCLGVRFEKGSERFKFCMAVGWS